ncbi:VOC family protein [Streptomyces sp. NPDC048404]|uniref:VOC family protein n=1 Tax=unclassified Streptomyces TaxID=2593676 RepID=UPI00341BF286
MSFTSHTLHLTARGTHKASAWYQQAFGAEELTRLVVPGGRLIHVQIRIGTLTLMLADEFPEMESFGPLHFGGTYGAIYLHADDVDDTWQRAVGAGATVIRPLSDTFWGEREGQLLDPSAIGGGSRSISGTSRSPSSRSSRPKRSPVSPRAEPCGASPHLAHRRRPGAAGPLHQEGSSMEET